MNNEIYYDIKSISLSERESFNNTIILLTLVKSKYYYIVGFSRPNNIIEIAFDFESDIHSVISESIILDFCSDSEWMLMSASLNNITASDFISDDYNASDGHFACDADKVIYHLKVRKDKLIPMSIEKMNKYILKAKSEIITFLERAYKKHLIHDE